MKHDTFPYYGPFNEQITQTLDTIDDAISPNQIQDIKVAMARYAFSHYLSEYDQKAVAYAANSHQLPVLHPQFF